MEYKNLLLFVFIFLINTNILVYSEDYGNISLTSDGLLTVKSDFKEDNVTIKCENSGCNIFFKGDFKDFTNFFSIVFDIPSIIKTIDLSNLRIIPKNLKEMFKGCSGLTEIKGLSKLNTSEVTDMSGMFYYCSSLKTLNLSNFNTSLVTDMSHMFENSRKLSSLDLSNFDTSSLKDMNSMFSGCSSLEEINISHFNTTSLTNMSKMFYDCQKLKSINLSSFGTISVKYMDQLFYNCSSLEILDIKNFDLINLESFNDIFTKMNNIHYIDLINIKIENNNIWKSLDKK